ncbi:hypothetical protein SCA6_001549 [Theobroma cacao]
MAASQFISEAPNPKPTAPLGFYEERPQEVSSAFFVFYETNPRRHRQNTYTFPIFMSMETN